MEFVGITNDLQIKRYFLCNPSTNYLCLFHQLAVLSPLKIFCPQ